MLCETHRRAPRGSSRRCRRASRRNRKSPAGSPPLRPRLRPARAPLALALAPAGLGGRGYAPLLDLGEPPGRSGRAAACRPPSDRSPASPGSRRNGRASSAVTSIVPPSGRVDLEAPRVEVKLAADPAGQERFGPAIFGVADDRMADRRHVRAQLVRAAGQRLQLDPGGAVAGAVDHPPAGLRRQAHVPRRHASSRRRCRAAWRAARRSCPPRPTGTPTTSAQ